MIDWTPGLLVAMWSGIAGYAVLLKSRRDLNRRTVVGGVLYSAAAGMAIYAGCKHFWPEALHWLPLALSVGVALSNRYTFDDILRFFIRGLGGRIDGDHDES